MRQFINRRNGWITTIALAGSFGATSLWVMADIEGSKHDFSTEGWSDEQLCLPCHIPHGAAPSEPPLWSRSVDPNKRYLETDGEGTVLLNPASAMCMSCHDGSTALDTVGGMSGSVFIEDERALIGDNGDLSTDHPVSVEYPTADPEFQPKSFVEATEAVKLPNGNVECTSCHDVHDQTGYDYMLVEDNAGSNLCLTCHKK